jgi:hypothetical protein
MLSTIKGDKMRTIRIFSSISLLVLAMLACNAASGIRAAQTEIPAMETAAPTVLGPMGTAAAEFTPPAAGTDSGAASTGGLGIKLADVRTIMDATQQFIFKDGSVNGKPAAIAGLSSSAATMMPGLVDNFSAAFIGDPENLNEIKVIVPNSDDKAAVATGLTLVTTLFSGILPPEVLFSFLPWIAQNYSSVPVGGSQELSAKNMKFTLSKTKTEVVLDIVPVK